MAAEEYQGQFSEKPSPGCKKEQRMLDWEELAISLLTRKQAAERQAYRLINGKPLGLELRSRDQVTGRRGEIRRYIGLAPETKSHSGPESCGEKSSLESRIN